MSARSRKRRRWRRRLAHEGWVLLTGNTWASDLIRAWASVPIWPYLREGLAVDPKAVAR